MPDNLLYYSDGVDAPTRCIHDATVAPICLDPSLRGPGEQACGLAEYLYH